MKPKKVRTVDGEATIVQGLHTTDDSAGYDAACKRVLSEKAILAQIMKACLDEYKDCNVNEIIMDYIASKMAIAGIPPKRNRKIRREYDRIAYRNCN